MEGGQGWEEVWHEVGRGPLAIVLPEQGPRTGSRPFLHPEPKAQRGRQGKHMHREFQ